MAVRLGVRALGAWEDLGNGKAGTAGVVPRLMGFGSLEPGSTNGVLLQGALPLAPATFVLGLGTLYAPFAGGVLVPTPDLTISGLLTWPDGTIFLPLPWPEGIPAGAELFFQYWISDPGATGGLSASNGLRAIAG